MAARCLAHDQMVYRWWSGSWLCSRKLESDWRKHHIGQRNGDCWLVWRLDTDICAGIWRIAVWTDLGAGFQSAGNSSETVSRSKGHCIAVHQLVRAGVSQGATQCWNKVTRRRFVPDRQETEHGYSS